ncbi:MAG: YggS family pyridoxal phosphate-dependent enzyme [Clostridia bacterium]
MSEIAENIKIVRAKVAEAAIKSGRNPSDITLVAATKMNDADRVMEAVRAGIDAAGENRVQELLQKFEEGAYNGVPLHFIGALQTNKVKYIVGKVSLIQSVDSIKLAREIGKAALKCGITQDILVEINIGGEESKSGIAPNEIDEFMETLSQIDGIKTRGLMTIPPILGNTHANAPFFQKMRQLFVDIGTKKYDNISMDFLSMGMSDDYCEAVLCGANMVRVGTGIFGRRSYAAI